MTSIAEYEEWKAAQKQQDVAAAQTVIGALEDQPDEVAKDIALANEFGKATGAPVPPTTLVKENRGVFQAEIEKLKVGTILSKSPVLTEWLRDEQNAAVSRDDLAGLSWFEGFGRGAGATLERGGLRFAQMGNQFMFEQAAGRAGDRKKTFGQLVDDQKLEVFDMDGKKLDTMAGPVEWTFALGRWIDARYADAIGTNDDAAAAHYAGKVKSAIDAMAATPKSMIAQDFERDARVKDGTLGETIASYAASFAKNPIGGMSWMLETAGESAPVMAAAIGTTVITKDPIKGAAVMGSGSYLTERYTSPAEYMKEKKINLGDPNEIAKLIADPTLMREAAERGVIRGAVIGAFDLLSVGIAGKSLAGNPVIEALAQTATQAFLGGGGEWAARVAAGQEIDWNEIVAEGLAEMATTPVDMGIAGRTVMQNKKKAEAAEARVDMFKALSDASGSSLLRERLPDAFRAFVDKATANGPVENVYVPASEFVGYFQSLDVDPHELADSLDGVTREDLDDAIASGGDLKIPTATYAARIAGSEHDAFLIENMRFDPNEFTAKEAKEFNARADDAMAEAFAIAEEVRKEDAEYSNLEASIYEEMVSRLRTAGRSQDVATSEAMLYPAFYRVMAERSGMGVDEFLAAYPLPRVEGAIPEGMKFKDVDELSRTLAEARTRKTVRDSRQTLLEFIAERGGINDVGGELRSRNADVIKRGKGKKTLKVARGDVGQLTKEMFAGTETGGKGYGADDVAAAAIEAGFMGDNPIVAEYQKSLADGTKAPDITAALWEAIDKELGGTLQYSAQHEADTAIADNEALDAVEEYLAQIGVSLDDDDAVIREAIGDGKQYAQVTPDQARNINMKVELPTTEVFAEAVANTAGAEIVEDGLLVDLVRFQKPEQAGEQSVRTGVFYLPAGSKDAKFYKRGGEPGQWYGGGLKVSGTTLIKRPLFVKGATGGKAPEAAYNALKGKGAAEKLSTAARSAATSSFYFKNDRGLFLENVSNFLTEHGADGSMADFIVDNSKTGNQLKYALQENVIAHAVREAGYDAVVGYGVGRKSGAFISEVFDVREVDYPVEGEAARIHPDFEGGKSYNQDTNGARGSIALPAGGVGNGDVIIRLFETADLSTFLHETGHYFLTVMEDLAARGEKASAADMAVVKDWWRSNAEAVAKDATKAAGKDGPPISDVDVRAYLDAGTTGNPEMDAAIDVGLQEQWARGFEAYLMEVRAPSADLQGVFEKFRSWMISVYKKIKALNVNLSPEIAQVFDRMLASDQEISRASEAVGGTAPLFSKPEHMGLTPEEYAKYLKLRTEAEDGAKSAMLREVMAPIKRDRDAAFIEERAKVAVEVEREVNAYRYFRALEWMGNKRWLGDGKPEDMPDMRLSKDILVERYGAGVLKTLPRGRQTIYTVKGGMDPDEAASWFGFNSGDEMIKALETAPKRAEAIEAETDKVMRDRHGDVLTDGDVEAKALDIVHSDKRGEWMAAELNAVVEVAGVGKAMTVREARALARTSVARMKVRDATNAQRFLAAERKAGEEAARIGAMLSRDKLWLDAADRRVKARLAPKGAATLASVENLNKAIDKRNALLASQTVETNVKGGTSTDKNGKRRTVKGGPRKTEIAGYNENVAKLIDAKRRQLLNHALYNEARKVSAEVGAAERLVQSLGKKAKREKIAGAGRRENAQIDYLNAIDEILERYSFKKTSGAADQRVGALNEYIEAMTAAGRENELAIPDSVLQNAAKRQYKTLLVEELRGVVDTLKNLEHMALRWNKLIEADKERDMDNVTEAIAASFDANVKKRPPGRFKGKAEDRRNTIRKFFDVVLNAGTLLREIDGFADLGAAYHNIKSPIDAAMNRLMLRKEKAANDLDKLYSVYSKKERRDMAVRMHMPELGLSLSKWEQIAIALNTGNAMNLQRLTDPKAPNSFTEAQVAAVLAKLDARDAKFVQSVWDYIGTFRNDIGAREQRTTGVQPKWVEATPVNIAGTDLRGGYYPIKYDPRLSTQARDQETKDIATELMAGRFGKAQTKNGHLKARAQSTRMDLDLDMAVLHRHVNSVIYDLEMSEPVSNSWRIIQDGRVRSKFKEAGKDADFDALEVWLKDVAEGEVRGADAVNRTARMMKTNFTAAKLAFNMSTVLLQITGVSQTMVVVGKKDFAIGVKNMFRRGTEADIVAKSAFMKSRQTTFNKDIYDMMKDPTMGPTMSRLQDLMANKVGPYGFWLMTKTQWWTVDMPSWLAGYQQGLRKFGNDEAKAIAHADGVVKRAQASGLFSDRSAIERGSISNKARQQDVVRLFTTLGSYMFAKFNVAYERSAKMKRTVADEGVSVRSAQEVTSWTLDMVLLFVVEAVLMAAIKGKLPDGEDDEEDGWLKFLAKETAFGVMSTIPLVRDAASAFKGYSGGGAYGGAVEDLTKGVIGSAKIIASPFTDHDITRSDVKQVINGLGTATGLPAIAAGRLVDAAMRDAEGEDVMPLEYLMGKMGKK